MQVEINNRFLFIVLPILFCTVAQLTGFGFLLPDGNGHFATALVPCVFALGLAMVIPSANRSWLMFGTCASFFLIYKLLHLLQPEYAYSSLVAAFLGPLATALLHPRSHKKITLTAKVLNRTITFFFLMLLSCLLCFLAASLYENIQSSINNLYMSHIYNDKYSFIYGIIYHFCETFGFGNFILEIRHLIVDTGVSQSFYSTTTAIFTMGLPGIYLALTAAQNKRKKLHYLILTLLAAASSTTGYSVSMLLICLLWMQPSLFGLYLINCVFYYIIGYQINFDPQNISKAFYNPNLNLNQININDVKFVGFALFTFVCNYLTSTVVLRQKQKYTQKTGQIIRVKPLIIDILSDIGTQDYSLKSITIIKALGGFDNIIHATRHDSTITFTVRDLNVIDLETLNSSGTATRYTDNLNRCLSYTMRDNTADVYNNMINIATRNLTDITSEYHQIEPYSIEKSKFKNLYTCKEEINAMDSN